MMTGTLNMVDLATRIAEVGPDRTVRAAFAFIVIGTGLKLAMFPLHAWLPNAYTYAPSVVSAFLAATATKVGVYMLLRLVFGLFGATFAFKLMPLGELLIIFALIGIIGGSLVAIFQRNLKRMLAYSSIAQIGYMALGIGLANLDGMVGGIVHLFNHAVMKATLFLALACVFYRTGAVDLESIRGLGRRMPWTIGAFTVAGFSLVGVPMTVGFISKWYLLSAAIERGLWPIAVVIVGASLLALIYIWRVVEAAYFQPPADDASEVVEAPVAMVAPMVVLAAACLYFGLDTRLTVDVARVAAAQLLGIGS
jgi:multicomponent Na+:H+ antiporter subunit D